MNTPRKYKFAFDIGGVLSSYPDEMRALMEALEKSGSFEVYYLTDMSREIARSLLQANSFHFEEERLLCANWGEDQNQCKSKLIKEHALDFIVDDHLPYLIGDHDAIGLLVTPKPKKIGYYHERWKDPSKK